MKTIEKIPLYPIKLMPLGREPRNDAERAVKGICTVSDVAELKKRLSSGNWIAIDAYFNEDGYIFILGWV